MSAKLFDSEAFGTALRIEMARRHITTRQAAVEIGCSPATVSRVCNEKEPDVENYLRISAWLAAETQARAPIGERS